MIGKLNQRKNNTQTLFIYILSTFFQTRVKYEYVHTSVLEILIKLFEKKKKKMVWKYRRTYLLWYVHSKLADSF